MTELRNIASVAFCNVEGLEEQLAVGDVEVIKPLKCTSCFGVVFGIWRQCDSRKLITIVILWVAVAEVWAANSMSSRYIKNLIPWEG